MHASRLIPLKLQLYKNLIFDIFNYTSILQILEVIKNGLSCLEKLFKSPQSHSLNKYKKTLKLK